MPSSPAETRRALKALLDLSAGYALDRRAELEAIVALGSASLTTVMRAFQRLPRRDDDHLRAGAIIAALAEPGAVERARTELAALDAG
jgi:hypothetical protein